MPEANVRPVGSGPGEKTVLAAYLQALDARPFTHDAQVWLVDECSGTGAHTQASTLQKVIDALNDLPTCLGRALPVLSHSRHTLDQLSTQAEDGPPRPLWGPTGSGFHSRTVCLQAGENEQDLDFLTEIIAGARPFTGRAVADEVRLTLSTLCTEFSRRSRLAHGEAPWVRFLDFTWPAPVVGRSLADLLQHQAPDVADAWRVWSMDRSISLNRHMAGVGEGQAISRHAVAEGTVFVLLSADACRTLSVLPSPAHAIPALRLVATSPASTGTVHTDPPVRFVPGPWTVPSRPTPRGHHQALPPADGRQPSRTRNATSARALTTS